ncbi:MAG: tRNA dihydrouridine synthase DusB [Verrucomicrobiota bacterium]
MQAPDSAHDQSYLESVMALTPESEQEPMDWIRAGTMPLFLAPMARFTDSAFRQLCKEQGADVMTTEFVMAESLLRSEKAWRNVDFTEEQRPMGVQVFGSQPERMAAAAKAVADRVRPDFIDINCGCPASRVTDIHAGSSLLKDPPHLAKIVEACVKAVPEIPVTVKIRAGWDHDQIVALEVGQRVQDVGARLLAIHGRTKEQGYRGDADWTLINEVAAALDIPVVGNGGIQTCADVAALRENSPVSGVMIGRAALGYPWLFAEIKHFLTTGEIPEAPSAQTRWDTIHRFVELLYDGPYSDKARDDVGWLRAKVKALTKDMPRGRKLRPRIDSIKHVDELRTVAEAHLRECANAETPAS